MRGFCLSRGLGDVYEGQVQARLPPAAPISNWARRMHPTTFWWALSGLLYTSDAADEEDRVDVGVRRRVK